MVSEEGIKVDSTKVEALRGWTSTFATEVCSFVGLAGYYLVFCSGFLYYSSSIDQTHPEEYSISLVGRV